MKAAEQRLERILVQERMIFLNSTHVDRELQIWKKKPELNGLVLEPGPTKIFAHSVISQAEVTAHKKLNERHRAVYTIE